MKSKAKKRNKGRRTIKRRQKKIFGGNEELRVFESELRKLVDTIEQKIDETPEYRDNPDARLYSTETDNIQKLFRDNLKYINEPVVSHIIYSISDQTAKHALIYIYHDVIEEHEYDNINVEEPVTSLPIKTEEITRAPSPPQIVPPTTEQLIETTPELETITYWTGLIDKIEKEAHDASQAKYRSEVPKIPYVDVQMQNSLEHFKILIKQLVVENRVPVCDILKHFARFYNTNEDFDTNYSQATCLVMLMIGYLTDILLKSNTCLVVLKGGKAMQFYVPIPSNDIDIVIAPKDGTLDDSEIEIIGNHIANFIIWILSFVYPTINLSKLSKGDGESKIIKLSINKGTGFLPIVDIGLGYNSSPEKIKELLNIKYPTGLSLQSKMSFKPEELEFLKTYKFNENYHFMVLGRQSIITEKLFYISKYLETFNCIYRDANTNFLKKAYHGLVFFITQLIAVNLNIEPHKQVGMLIKCIKYLYPDYKIKKRGKEPHSLTEILENYTHGLFVNKWLVWDSQQFIGLFPDIEVMCMPDNTEIKLPNWGNRYTTVGIKFRGQVPKLTLPTSYKYR